MSSVGQVVSLMYVLDMIAEGANAFRFQQIHALRGCAVEWIERDGLIVSRGRALYRTGFEGERPRLIGQVPRPLAVRAISSLRLGQRFLRELFYNVIPLEDGRFFVSFGRQTGILEHGYFAPLRGLRRKTRILRGGCAVAADGSIYWGEYFDNADRGEVDVYRWDPASDRARIVHTFARGEIYHVHGVRADPVDGSLLCLTGDRLAECRFLRTFDGFRTLEPVGEGDETWRFVTVIPQADGWLVATDAEFRENQIATIARSTGARTTLTEVDGPIYYSAQVGDTTFFGSTAERCVIQPHPQATLYAVRDGRAIAVRTFQKDLGRARLAWRLFLPGALHFPINGGDRRILYISGMALHGFDARVLRVEW